MKKFIDFNDIETPNHPIKSYVWLATCILAFCIFMVFAVIQANAGIFMLSLLFMLLTIVESIVLEEIKLNRQIAIFNNQLEQLAKDELVVLSNSPELSSDSQTHIIKYLNKNHSGWSCPNNVSLG